jgi:succinate dehydrogenase/fumarate reductase flavoprotein subunit
MEMVQYHPTTLAGIGLLITEGARGEGAHLYNAEGERFMEKYAPNKMELASRDVVSRAEQTEINEGRGFPDGTVALDITVVPKQRIHEALREIVMVGRDFAGVDITREPIHIKPGNHYVMGGIKTNVDGETDVPGLYAAGERFMEKYAPNKMELASRDVVSRAEQTEINEGRGFPDGTVALDITVVPKKRIHEALREIVLVGRDFAGVDITKEPIHKELWPERLEVVDALPRSSGGKVAKGELRDDVRRRLGVT